MTHPELLALVVEDDASWQQILAEILSDAGLTVDVAGNLPDAIEHMRAKSYRLAIVDLSLSGSDHHNQDGLQALSAVQRYAPNGTAILLTGFATVELAVSAIQDFGAFTCLRKESFRRSDFRETINQALAIAPVEKDEPISASEEKVALPTDAPDTPVPLGLALLIEDDAGWRSLLAELLIDAGYDVHLSTSYVEALGQLNREKYNLAVVDLSLASSSAPEMNLDGYNLLDKTHQIGIPAIIVSGFADRDRIEQAYAEFGIFAALEKQAFDRSAFLKTVTEAGQSQSVDPALESLTPRELEVLVLLAKGLTNKEIAAKLFISANTIKRHLKSIFVKLDVNTRAAAAAKAINFGIGSPPIDA